MNRLERFESRLRAARIKATDLRAHREVRMKRATVAMIMVIGWVIDRAG